MSVKWHDIEINQWAIASHNMDFHGFWNIFTGRNITAK